MKYQTMFFRKVRKTCFTVLSANIFKLSRQKVNVSKKGIQQIYFHILFI